MLNISNEYVVVSYHLCLHLLSYQPGKTDDVLCVYRVSVDRLALMADLVDQACLVYKVRKANQELADQDRRVSLEDLGLVDVMERQA